MYVITGATGNTGKPLTLALLSTGKKVRIISRSADKAKELTNEGAELFLGDTSQVEVLNHAFKGATAVYAMVPFEISAKDYTAHQRKHVDAIAAALQSNRVPYVVTLSSVGADLEIEGGVVQGLHYMEQKFNAIKGLNTLHLRPTYFMENTLSMIGMIKQMGLMGSPVRGDLMLNMIATKDISHYAAKRMIALDFQGHHVQYLLGQRDLTYSEVAKIYGRTVGKPDLSYVEFSYEDFKRGFMQMGASESLADNMNIFIKSLNEGRVLAKAKRDSESTTKTSLEDFAKVFASIYHQS